MEENQSVESVATPKAVEPGVPQDKLVSILTQKQKKALGLLPETYQSEKAKARNEMLRERMRKINEERKAAVKAAVKGVVVEKKKKRKQPEPSEEEENDSSSEEKVIQKKAKKVSETIKHLSKVEERLLQLQEQNKHNPYFRLMCRK